MSDLPVEGDLDAVTVFNLLQTHGHLAPMIDAGLREQQTTATQFNALLVLKAAGSDGLRMGEIGKRLVVTRANVTGLVDRMERRGLVSRRDMEDRRATVVNLTDAGRSLLRDTLPHYSRLISQLTSGLTERDKRSLVRVLTKLRRELRRQRRERAGRPARKEKLPE